MDLQTLAHHLETIVREGVKNILLNTDIELKIENKGYQDIVTAKDKLMEDFLIESIKEICPKDLFIAEEGHHSELTSNRTWIIDPIDGTLNFAQGNPNFGVQLALFDNMEGLLSIVYLPAIDEYYYAIRNEGAYLNHKKLNIKNTLSIEEAIVTFGDFSKSNPLSRTFQSALIDKLHSKAMKIRIQGSSSIDFAFIAGQKNHCHIMFSKRIWEIKPGLLLLEEAGAYTDLIDGTPYGFPGNAVIATCSLSILENIRETMQSLIEAVDKVNRLDC